MKRNHILYLIVLGLISINSLGVHQSVSGCGHYWDNGEEQTELNDQELLYILPAGIFQGLTNLSQLELINKPKSKKASSNPIVKKDDGEES